MLSYQKELKDYKLALKLAFIAYDKDTLLHVNEVSNLCKDLKERTVAILHDIIEDTLVTISLLQHYDFEIDIITALIAITRTNNDTYNQYLQRVKNNDLAKRVKLVDLNVNIKRCEKSAKGNLLNRYKKALTEMQK